MLIAFLEARQLLFLSIGPTHPSALVQKGNRIMIHGLNVGEDRNTCLSPFDNTDICNRQVSTADFTSFYSYLYPQANVKGFAAIEDAISRLYRMTRENKPQFGFMAADDHAVLVRYWLGNKNTADDTDCGYIDVKINTDNSTVTAVRVNRYGQQKDYIVGNPKMSRDAYTIAPLMLAVIAWAVKASAVGMEAAAPETVPFEINSAVQTCMVAIDAYETKKKVYGSAGASETLALVFAVRELEYDIYTLFTAKMNTACDKGNVEKVADGRTSFKHFDSGMFCAQTFNRLDLEKDEDGMTVFLGAGRPGLAAASSQTASGSAVKDMLAKYDPWPDYERTDAEKDAINAALAEHGDDIPDDKTVYTAKIICNAVKHGKNVIPDNLMFFGEPGSGKSTAVIHLALMLNLRPFVFACSPETTSGDLQINILPDASNMSDDKEEKTAQFDLSAEKTKFDAKVKAELDELSKKFDPMLAVVNPAEAYRKLTGRDNQNADTSDVTSAYAEMASAIKNQKPWFADALAGANNSGSSIRYRYVKSPLLQCIQDGGIIDVQEMTLMRASELASMNCYMDRGGRGTAVTGEEIVRNPRCIVVYTTNVDLQGCKPVNGSVLSRCNMVLNYDLPVDDVLIQRAKDVSGLVDCDLIERMVKAFRTIHDMLQERITENAAVDTRVLFDWATQTDLIGDPLEAAQYTIIAKSSISDKEARTEAEKIVLTQFGNDMVDDD